MGLTGLAEEWHEPGGYGVPFDDQRLSTASRLRTSRYSLYT